MKRILTLISAALLCCTLLASCGAPQADDGRVQVVATLFPQYDFAKNIAGDRADVTLLLDFGADAHTYDPTPADMLKIANADLFIYTGSEMELWADKLLKSADIAEAVGQGRLRVLDLSKCVALLPAAEHEQDGESGDGDGDGDEGHGHDHGEYDPHIWTSFENAETLCASIADALAEIDPDGASRYAENLAEYTEKLEELKAEMQGVRQGAVRNCAYFGGSFAFAYLFDEFSLDHLAVFAGCASHTEASPAAMLALVGAVRESGAPAVLYDSLSEKKTAEAIAAETGVKVLRLHAVHAGNN